MERYGWLDICEAALLDRRRNVSGARGYTGTVSFCLA